MSSSNKHIDAKKNIKKNKRKKNLALRLKKGNLKSPTDNDKRHILEHNGNTL
jgi:hypothetical protein